MVGVRFLELLLWLNDRVVSDMAVSHRNIGEIISFVGFLDLFDVMVMLMQLIGNWVCSFSGE